MDWKAPQVRMRAQSEGERRDADEAADSGAAQSFDAAQLWLLLGDHNMQRHQVKNAAARSGAFCPPERQNAADDDYRKHKPAAQRARGGQFGNFEH